MLAERMAKLGAGAAVTIVLARQLGLEQFGLWMLFLATWGLIDMAREGATSSAYLRFASGLEGERFDQVTTTLLATVLLSSVPVMFGACIVGWVFHLDGTGGLLVGTTVVLAPIAGACAAARAILQCRGRFDALLAMRVVQGGTMLGFVACGAGSGELLWMACAGLIAGHATATLLGATLAVGFFYWDTRDLYGHGLRLVRHGLYALASRIGSALHKTCDVWLVAALGGPAMVGIYTVAWKLTDLTEIPLQALIKVLVPSISRTASVSRSQATAEAARAVVVTSWISLPIALGTCVLAEPFLGMALGSAFTEAARLVAILVLFNLLRPWDRNQGVLLDAIGLPEVNSAKVCGSLLVNVTGSTLILLVCETGRLEGVAAVSCVAMVVGIGIGEWALYRRQLAPLPTGFADGQRWLTAQVWA